MTVCPSCGGLTPADSDYCINCGYKFRRPDIPSGNAEAQFAVGENGLNGTYDANNGGQYAPAYAAAPAAVSGAAGAKFQAAARILGYVSQGFAGFVSLISVIFAFLLGAKVVSGGSSGVSAGSVDIFYCFDKIYGTVEEGNRMAHSITLVGAIISTVVASLILVGTFAAFVVTLVRLIRVIRRTTEKSVLKPAATAFFIYAGGTAAFMLLFDSEAYSAALSAQLAVNDATVAGLVLGSIGLAVSITCAAVGKGRETLRPIGVTRLAGGLVLAAIAAVVLAMLSRGITFGTGGDSVTLGVSSLFSSIGSMLLSSQYMDNEEWLAMCDMYDSQLAMNIVVVIFTIAAVIFAASALGGYLSGKATKKSFVAVMFAGICGLVCGAVKIVSANNFAEWFTESEGETFVSYIGSPVALIIFSVFLIAGAIAYAVLVSRYKRNETR